MRINKTNHISPLSTPNNNRPKNKSGVTKPRNTDRIDIDSGSISRMEIAIKENLIKFQTRKISVERLDSIKQRIENGSYRVNTSDIIKAMLS